MARGDETRLFLLAELVRRGQAHGHELRREAQIGRTELWTNVHIGSIYTTLRRMETEGLVEAVRTERNGRMPERTVYTLTAEGRRELKVLRDGTLREVAVPSDPFDLALSCADDLEPGQLAEIVSERLVILQSRSAALARQRRTAAAYLDHRDQLLFDHVTARLQTEIDWHNALHAALLAQET